MLRGMLNGDVLPDLGREMGQSREAQVFRIGPLQGPRFGFIQHQAVCDKKFKPIGLKAMGLKHCPREHLAILAGDGRTDDRLQHRRVCGRILGRFE